MRSKSRAGLYFLLPGVIWVLIFTIFPLLYSLVISFQRRRLGRPASWIGFGNYADIFSDGRVGETVTTSIFLTVSSLLLTLLLGTFVAWLFNQQVPGLNIFRGIMTMPIFVAPIALGFLGKVLFNEQSGPINHLLRTVIPIAEYEGVKWFTSPWGGRTAVMFADVWQWTPFVFIVTLAAMQSIPDDLYEAARLDTASEWDLFSRITLPIITPAIGTVAMLRMVETFKILDIPLSMTGGGPGSATQTYSYYIYITGLKNFNQGYGSALAWLLVIIAIILTTIYFVRVSDRFE
jgi:multiple sugar transport system permease protein